MPTISFKTKPEKIYNADGSLAYERIKLTKIDRQHCDMEAFRRHPKFGPYANSDMFALVLRRELKARDLGDFIRLDRELPQGVTVDRSKFLAQVFIEV